MSKASKGADVAKARALAQALVHEPAKWDALMATLDAWAEGKQEPVVSRQAEISRDPFKVLVATIISLRTTDEVTGPVSERLFALASTPKEMAALPVEAIAEAIHPANFYISKAERIRDIAIRIEKEFGGKVPSDMDTLLSFKGVGRKTANLVLTEGFDLPGICVDVHVHRILNRMGMVKTKSRMIQRWPCGQCAAKALEAFKHASCSIWPASVPPQSPWCSICPLSATCKRVGVERTANLKSACPCPCQLARSGS